MRRAYSSTMRLLLNSGISVAIEFFIIVIHLRGKPSSSRS
jgi:hypothetical protein